jgi:hypothetical protein
MIRNQKISTCAIICIDEHEDRITSNLRHLIQSNFFDEVVLLINGSTDYIEKVAGRFVEDYSIKIIDLNWYLNTSYAISTNVKCFVSDIIVCIKDINDTNRNYQSELIAPLILDKINLTKNKSIKSGYSKSTNTIKNLNGTRAIWKKDSPECLDTIRQQDELQ